jgi:hypothetical protein
MPERTLFDPVEAEEPVAHARAGDRPTSHEAAASIRDLTARQVAVLDCLRRFPAGAADVEWIAEYKNLRWAANWPPQSDSGLRTRRAELFTAEKVEDVGERHIGRRNHTVWRATA